MWEVLNLPEKYKINKKVTVEMFLKKANMNESEKRFVLENVSNIELKYDICFKDKSEIIIMDISCETEKYEKVAKLIAQSIPYQCIIFMRRKLICSISFFQIRDNKNWSGRSVVEKQFVTPDFYVDNITGKAKTLISGIHGILLNSKNNALSAIERCVEIIKRYENLIGESDYSEKAEIIQKGFTMNPNDIEYYYKSYSLYSFCCGYYDDCDYCDGCDDCCDYFDYLDCYDFDIDLRSLLWCAYYFYYEKCMMENRDCPEDVDNDETLTWLENYAKICKYCINDIYKVNLSDKFLYILGACFARKDIIGAINYLDETIIETVSDIILGYDEDW